MSSIRARPGTGTRGNQKFIFDKEETRRNDQSDDFAILLGY